MRALSSSIHGREDEISQNATRQEESFTVHLGNMVQTMFVAHLRLKHCYKYEIVFLIGIVALNL